MRSAHALFPSPLQESEEAAPGEKRRFLGVREQRVTHLAVFLSLGFSASAASVLR